MLLMMSMTAERNLLSSLPNDDDVEEEEFIEVCRVMISLTL